MDKKPLFTNEELQAVFGGTDAQKYAIAKKDLSKIIIRYLLANPQIKSENEAVYEKAIFLQTKNILCNPFNTSYEQAVQLVENLALFDIDSSKNSYTPQDAMNLIMEVFFHL